MVYRLCLSSVTSQVLGLVPGHSKHKTGKGMVMNKQFRACGQGHIGNSIVVDEKNYVACTKRPFLTPLM